MASIAQRLLSRGTARIVAASSQARVTVAAATAAARALSSSQSASLHKTLSMSKQEDNVYETPKYVQEYLAFHFGQDKPDYMPYQSGAKDAVDFNVRIAKECSQYLKKGENDNQQPTRALDVGCAVGRACFELARTFDEVVGVDFSQAFVDCCNELKANGQLAYERLDEGVNYSQHEAHVPADIDRSKCTFHQGDACSLDPSLGTFDVVLMANLLCRLPNPQACLDSLPHFVKEGGHVITTSPFSWFDEYTDRDNWLGGKDGLSSRDGLVARMEANGFSLIKEDAIPFLIREHARKYQLVFPHLAVFQRAK